MKSREVCFMEETMRIHECLEQPPVESRPPVQGTMGFPKVSSPSLKGGRQGMDLCLKLKLIKLWMLVGSILCVGNREREGARGRSMVCDLGLQKVLMGT